MNSKQLIQSVIPNWNGRLAAHHVGYLGNGAVHRGVPYNATDPKVVAKKLSLMQSDGVDIVIETWQGIYAQSCNLDAGLTAAMCVEFGMQFMLLLDPWCAKLNAGGVISPSTANVTASLLAASTQAIINSSCYAPEKYVLDFNTGADLTTLAFQLPSLKFLAMNQGFSWITIPTITDSPLRNAAAVANLAAQHNNPAMKVASFCSSFDDSGMPLPAGVSTQAAFDAAGGQRDLTQSVWGGPARILESFSGELALQQLATIPATMPIIAMITWDDYDEQSSGPREKILAEEQGVNWAAL
jgi:hypothetical protein